ncbi:unnamed protein product [Rotaria sp. Silwood1]|nr:unnamed protein product [Rotaria sp. Silwood1]CAF1063381.1 unnamed protein product [Rotaria sp. Silwood1]CAF3419046.1 unnamed protein product [Rotaria sp. Silwood1]CAF3430517.1 unnamed protein product [Rotaria sp. Silwood1]CAF3435173.1 unnamed protein product [Rotaria sp. Silwood1]
MLFCIFAVYALFLSNIYSYEFPFSTLGNSIIDANGIIVRTKCVTWPGSMETLLPEGLQHNSIDNIVLLIKEMNMTCVRLTYSIDVTRSSNLTVYQSLSRLNLILALEGFIENNPLLIHKSISYVFDSVLNTLGKYNILVLLDNHISKAMWCCHKFDGNGFWGDQYFDVEQWIDGLIFMAKKTINRPYVIAMIYEAHWYSWSNYGHSNECNKMKAGIQNAWGFILVPDHSYTAPVWLTEFGTNVDQFTGDNTFIDCVKGFFQTSFTETMSWSYWVLAGSYYIRSGTIELHESFGLLTDNWKEIKSKSFIDILSTM